MRKVLNVGVIGGGKFGMALGSEAAMCGHNVLIYDELEKRITEINSSRKNTSIFDEEFTLPEKLKGSSDLKKVLGDSNIIIHAIPVQVSYNFIRQNINFIPENVPYVVASKGMLQKQKKFFSEIWDEMTQYKKIPHCILSGPSYAIEMMRGFPTQVSLGCKSKEIGEYVVNNLYSDKFILDFTTDVIGVEIGGALKNPLAIAAGIVEGNTISTTINRSNTSAALVVRGIKEMCLFSEKYGGRTETLYGLSGLGDIMLTCMGALSRDKAFGKKLCQGLSLNQIPKTELVEGVPTAKILGEIIENENLDMPIFKTLSNILHKNAPQSDLFKLL